ncbi:hypothetical protein R3P38DRAFT_3252880 [Favolaschia claudopus]|uniref:Uncharacterized protein n=1 Tax=Favolaschia claudopus TaxID=2862362 RepID=A0AAW0DYR8_9AGAR
MLACRPALVFSSTWIRTLQPTPVTQISSVLRRRNISTPSGTPSASAATHGSENTSSSLELGTSPNIEGPEGGSTTRSTKGKRKKALRKPADSVPVDNIIEHLRQPPTNKKGRAKPRRDPVKMSSASKSKGKDSGRNSATDSAAAPATSPTRSPRLSATSKPAPQSSPNQSVSLLRLPPFTTLSEVGRMVLNSGVSPGAVLAIQMWLSSRSDRQDANDNAETSDEQSSNVPWKLGATIDFCDADVASAFAKAPMLLEVFLPPAPPDSQPPSVDDRPCVRPFPPSAHVADWTPAELVSLARFLPTWRNNLLAQLKQGRFVESPPESANIETHVGPEDGELVEMTVEDNEDALLERAKVLVSMWDELESTPDTDGPPGSTDSKANCKEVLPAVSAEDGDPLKVNADQTPNAEGGEREAEALNTPYSAQNDNQPISPGPEPMLKISKSSSIELSKLLKNDWAYSELLQRAQAQLSPNSVLVSIPVLPLYKAHIFRGHPRQTRWLAMRVPGSGVPILTPPEAPANEPETKTILEEQEEHEDPAIQLYANALRKALARERELEATLWDARIAAQEQALQMAQTAAEAQVRSVFGAFGALEGVWIRVVRAPPPGARSPNRDNGNTDADADTESRPNRWVYELHALVAFAEVQTAARARTLVPVQFPAFERMGLRHVSEPWPEALGGEPPGESELKSSDAVREGWAVRLAREHHAQAQARERHQERERQRGAAEGTWGKERLSEVRERLRRDQRHAELAQQKKGGRKLRREEDDFPYEVAYGVPPSSDETSARRSGSLAASALDSRPTESGEAVLSDSSDSDSRSASDSESDSESDSDSDSDKEDPSELTKSSTEETATETSLPANPALPYVALF